MGYSTNTVANLPIILRKPPTDKEKGGKKKKKTRCTKERGVLSTLLGTRSKFGEKSCGSCRNKGVALLGGKGRAK